MNFIIQHRLFLDRIVHARRRGFGERRAALASGEKQRMIERAVPFICQHLALIIEKKDIVPSMHEAYDRIASSVYGFGTFIAGPSKTADIEQSLVLGAHGPRSMVAFILDTNVEDAGFY